MQNFHKETEGGSHLPDFLVTAITALRQSVSHSHPVSHTL